jgi:hypothetical protein
VHGIHHQARIHHQTHRVNTVKPDISEAVERETAALGAGPWHAVTFGPSVMLFARPR